MDILALLRLISKNLKWLILFPLVVTVVVIFLTKELPRNYESKTLVYTGIASGYDITSGDNNKVDYFAVNTAFDNLITTINARETTEEVALQLLSQHLQLDSAKVNVLGREGMRILKESLNKDLREQLTVKGDVDQTYKNLQKYLNGSVKNEIQQLLSSSNPIYSIKAVNGGMSVKRVKNSDMLELKFVSIDPGVAQHTLFFLANAFIDRFKQLKGSETSNVVGYFENRLKRAFDELQLSEEKLKEFGIDNRIINYQEQTKYIAASKEDLESELYNKRMSLEAAKAAIERIESKLSDRLDIVKENSEINKKRQELTNVNMLITNAEVYKESQDIQDSLMRESFKLQADLRDYAEKIYNRKYSLEGVKSDQLLEQWLNKIIEYEEIAASLVVFQERKKEFNELYDEFAPLGSMLGKLEREVGIQEKQYLEVLHGLNTARLREQNLRMSNSLTVLDEPFFPIEPQASKRAVMVIGGFAGSLILLLVIIFAKEFLDNSIKTPSNAEKLSNLKLIGALPLYKKKERKLFEAEQIEHSLLEQIISTIHLETQLVDPHKEYHQINLFSLRSGEGKTYLSSTLTKKLNAVNGKVLFLTPNLNEEFANIRELAQVDAYEYEVSSRFVKSKHWSVLIESYNLPDEKLNEYSIILIEFPSINANPIPATLVQGADLSICVTSANRVWNKADTHLIQLYLNSAFNKTMIFLNKVEPDLLEGLLGEVPKKRNATRRFLKKIVTLNFNRS